jgi:murein DD-endopeptidase MepM/ murein hydrolase activator NlpD
MKKFTLLSLLLASLFQVSLNAQTIKKCLSDESRAQIKAELIQTSQRLESEGLLNFNPNAVVSLEWPLQQAAGYDDPGYYATINYVDQDNTSGILDYNCGSRTYDGHRGIDIMLWPYRWEKQANNAVEVIAAAPGTILGKTDGNYDLNCNCDDINWNVVYIQHDDGSVAWYGHMKANSLTSKGVGETVETGEFLGVVGSSGCSTDPHLHFEFYANNLQTILVEPFAGDCNNLNGNTSWWADQKPYREPKINKLMTHYDAPEQNFGCPSDNDLMNTSDQFDPGDVIYFSPNYQDQLILSNTVFKVYRPDNSIWQSWDFSAPDTYSSSWWYWYWTLPADAPDGIWTFEAVYEGVTYTHDFQVGNIISTKGLDENQQIEVFPNPFSDHFILNIENINKEDLEIEIYSVDNKEILSINSLQNDIVTIPASNLAKGIYFLKVKTKDGDIVKKLVKM